ncbi:MAG: hypothetical protein CVU03_02260 [Bacteroidetes bacterium HGW-Bacteroidetes-2]|jgi:hypothetical protein|nr:MAG: hypothetical protein CVU13_06055 [Bacteroidetes bacterium HGW-Bacteroidetes-8]PKP26719.1 MAG: hypothetical protein CVU03_02260 [Bacteroidetes bacterium HGW-Bacteroidetes-2]
MKLENYKKKSHEYTAKASEIARQLNFAGIGIIWIVKTTFPELKLSDSELLLPLVLIALSLVFDFLQYLVGGIIWIIFYNNKQKNGISNTADVQTTKWRSRVLYTFYYIKFTLMFIAYLFIIKILFQYF